MNKEFFIRNRKKLWEYIENDSVLLLFSGSAPQKSADENYNYTPNRNFYYSTGIDRENIILMLTKVKDKYEETLFIEESDPVLAKWVGEKMSIDKAAEISGIENIDYIDNFYGKLNRLFSTHSYNNMYLDLERAGWEYPLTNSQSFSGTVMQKYPYLKIKNIYQIICGLRMIKTDEEIKNVKRAIDITYEGIQNMMKNAKPGMMEYEIEANFDFVLKSRGVTDYAFHTIAASGENGTVLHYVNNNCKTGDNDLILCDLGAQYNYYNADITRTFPVSGRFTDRQREIYNVVLKAQLAVIDMIKPGVPFKELNETCRRVLAEGCKSLGIIKDDSELSNYYYHGVSHYLGLDTHDVGTRDIDLMPGMLLTVEPGLYISEEKIGIRIEDNVLVTAEGNEILSKDIIKEISEIEEFMAR